MNIPFEWIDEFSPSGATGGGGGGGGSSYPPPGGGGGYPYPPPGGGGGSSYPPPGGGGGGVDSNYSSFYSDMPTTLEELWGDEYNLSDYEGMFPDYDPLKEQLAGEKLKLNIRGMRSEGRGYLGKFTKQRQATGFAGQGAKQREYELGRDVLLEGIGSKLSSLNLGYAEQIHGFREDWQDKMYDRLADLIKAEADISPTASNPTGGIPPGAGYPGTQNDDSYSDPRGGYNADAWRFSDPAFQSWHAEFGGDMTIEEAYDAWIASQEGDE